LSVRHFEMVATTALKSWRRGPLQWHDLPTKFHENLPTGSEVYRGDRHADRMVMSLAYYFSFREESRL